MSGFVPFGLALLGFATSASAAETWEVKGVWPEDVLQVRAAPDGKSAIVGALAASEQGITVTGAAQSGWLPIQQGDLKGYVSDKYLMKSPPAGSPGGLVCSGTEPFWSLQIDGHTATFDAAGAQAATSTLRPPLQPSSVPDRWLYEASVASDPLKFVMVQETRRCVAGITGAGTGPRRYEVTIYKGGALYAGCCDRL